MKCLTNLISDAPVLSDSFGPHKRIAEAIVELLRTEKGGKSIGLEGSYGSGKTTVVNLIHAELKHDKSFLLIPFDVWAHEGDPLRRTFLETLIRKVKDKSWIDEDEWERRAAIIAQRREEKTTKTIPQLKPIAKVIGVSLFFIPFGLAFLNASARELETINPELPISWKFVIGTVLTILPLLVFLIWWMTAKTLRKFSDKKKKDDSLWALLFSKTITEEQAETMKTPNPTSIEFEDTFKDLMREALRESDRRVLLVLDNLDRVEPNEALSIWATLQTFLQYSPYSSEEWFERLWVLVLYDPEGISRLWDKKESPTTVIVKPSFDTYIQNYETHTKKRTITSSFLDKSFQSRFNVPPPALSDWHTHLTALLREALPEHTNPEFHEIYRVLSIHSAKDGVVPTIRRLKLFVNQIGIIHRQWQHTFPLSHVAYYVLSYGQGDDNIEWFLSHPAEEYKGFISEDLRESLAALAFNVEKEKALQFLLNDRIRNALAEGAVEKLLEYAKFHGGFWEVLEKVVQGHGEWRDGRPGKILNAAYCLRQSHVLENSERPEEAQSVVNELCNAASDVDRWRTFDDRKAKGLAALYQWRQDKNFAHTLLKAIPESLFSLEPDKYKAIDVGNWIKGLQDLRSEFESLGLADIYSNGIVTPLKSKLNRYVQDTNSPSINTETNIVLEFLFELHYFDIEANQYLNELIKETGYILLRLHHAISRPTENATEDVVSAVAWCLFILLRAYPDATKHSIYLGLKEQRDSVLNFLELKYAEQVKAGTSTEAEGTKQSDIVKKNVEAITKKFTDLLIRHNDLYLLFRLLDAEPASKPFVVQCLLYLIKDTAYAKSLFTPEVLIERWSFLYNEFTGSDYRYPTLFDRLIQLISLDGDLVKLICETDFDPKQAGLYKALATNLEENDSRTQEFRHWCVFSVFNLWIEKCG